MINSVVDQGLVICAKTRQNSAVDADLDLSSLFKPSFPSRDLVGAAARLFPAMSAWSGHEGPRARLCVAPGVVAIERRDLARAQRSGEREIARAGRRVDEDAAHLLTHGEHLPDPPAQREVTSWSRKSRARMTRRLGELDYTKLLGAAAVPAMVTLTYPGDWQSVAPTGRAVKAHLEAFRLRFRHAWGTPLVAVWKLEFQRRGAPHFHLLMVPPHGVAHGRNHPGLSWRAWLSATWADIVAHPDLEQRTRHLAAGTGVDFAEGLKARDPRRIAVYFTKHGTFRAKEYQHVVPDLWRAPGAGPGRFWGYWQLERASAAVELHPQDAAQLARTIRRWARAQGTTRQMQVPRTPGGRPVAACWQVVGLAGAQLVAARPPPRLRRVRRRVNRLRGGAGWVSVNNGPGFASQLARFLGQLYDRVTGLRLETA